MLLLISSDSVRAVVPFVCAYSTHFGLDGCTIINRQFTIIVKRMNQSNHWLLITVKQNLRSLFHGARQKSALVAENLNIWYRFNFLDMITKVWKRKIDLLVSPESQYQNGPSHTCMSITSVHNPSLSTAACTMQKNSVLISSNQKIKYPCNSLKNIIRTQPQHRVILNSKSEYVSWMSWWITKLLHRHFCRA